MFNFIKNIFNNKNKKSNNSICYKCKKHCNCIHEDNIPVVRCPLFKRKII